jgi:hypothetical protein
VEDVPAYEWKTPLQRGIQFMKRHRDVMFSDNSELAPISMIITNLAANAYDGEPDLWLALVNMVENMPKFIRTSRPRIPNPADPAEDYADKWAKNPALEQNFWRWHRALKADLAKLPEILGTDKLDRIIRSILRIELTQDELEELVGRSDMAVPAIVKTTPPLVMPSAPRPWGQ